MRMLCAVLAFAALSLAAPAEPWTAADLVQPAQLAARLKNPGARKPNILYVGFGVLYRSKHLPGAVNTGPAAKQEGLEALRATALKLPRTSEVIIYCGCCPVEHCPNIRPAFLMLRELGFKQAKLLWLPTSFYKDWIEKGYPVQSGE